MAQTVKERLLAYLKVKGLSQGKFERMCGLSNGYVNNLKRSVTAEKLVAIKSACTDLNTEWLMTGEGEMLNDSFEHRDAEKSVAHNHADFRLVPLINIDSVGGIHSENITTPSEQYAIRMMPFTEAREGDVAIIQSGTSMYPTIPPGSALLIREVIDWTEYFGYGGIYVIWLKDGRRITKEIRRYDADPKNYVWCVSYNPDVADEELPKSMIRGVWKVVKYIADFGW